MRVLLLIALFLFVGALFVISNENLHLKNKIEAKKFTDLYYGWLVNLAMGLKGLTGQVISSNWFPGRNITANLK